MVAAAVAAPALAVVVHSNHVYSDDTYRIPMHYDAFAWHPIANDDPGNDVVILLIAGNRLYTHLGVDENCAFVICH